MADTKISVLTAATVAAAANEFAINEAGTSKKLTASLLRDLIGSQSVVLSSDHAISSTTGTEVTGLQMTLVAGTYQFSYFLIVQAGTASAGPTFAINYTGTVTRMTAMLKWPGNSNTAASGSINDAHQDSVGKAMCHAVARTEATSASNLTGPTTVVTTNQDAFVTIKGIIEVSDGGDLELWHASSAANSTTVESGSNLIVTRVV